MNQPDEFDMAFDAWWENDASEGIRDSVSQFYARAIFFAGVTWGVDRVAAITREVFGTPSK